jgi:hypothetical protein
LGIGLFPSFWLSDFWFPGFCGRFLALAKSLDWEEVYSWASFDFLVLELFDFVRWIFGLSDSLVGMHSKYLLYNIIIGSELYNNNKVPIIISVY